MKKQIAYIHGLGKSGQAAALFLQKGGYEVIGIDKKRVAISDLSDCPLLVESEVDELNPDALFVQTPGISSNHPLVEKAQSRGLVMTSEMELGLDYLRARGKTLLAITGSNGKTTTTLLVAHLLKQYGKRAIACGNVGLPLLSCLDQADIFAVEVSSFQLETLKKRYFDAAVILNICPNHLDRHTTFEEYKDLKWHLADLVKEDHPVFVGPSLEVRRGVQPLISFEDCERPLHYLSKKPHESWVRRHDIENIQAAFSLTRQVGLDEKVAWSFIDSFVKPPHRLEFVDKLFGVNYFNDSKATTVEAVEGALNAMEGSVILIAGGIYKGGNFGQWSLLGDRIRKILAIGQASEKIKADCREMDVEECQTLQIAVRRAYELAQVGENVLLSPGCSSFDQFQNYEMRGDCFKKLVKDLK